MAALILCKVNYRFKKKEFDHLSLAHPLESGPKGSAIGGLESLSAKNPIDLSAAPDPDSKTSGYHATFLTDQEGLLNFVRFINPSISETLFAQSLNPGEDLRPETKTFFSWFS